MLKLYTKTDCVYCDMMKSKLDIWGYEYEVINIQEDTDAKTFILNEGHKTVPQLYYNDKNVNRGINTDEFTKSILEETMK